MPEIQILDSTEVEQIAERVVRKVVADLPLAGSPSDFRPLANVAAACEYLGISETKLRGMIRAGTIPYHDVDGSYRFDLSELREATRAKPKLRRVS